MKPADNGSPITAYELQRKEGNGVYAGVFPAPEEDVLTYSDKSVVTGTTYVYRIRASNKDGAAEAWSDDVTATAEQRAVIYGRGWRRRRRGWWHASQSSTTNRR